MNTKTKLYLKLKDWTHVEIFYPAILSTLEITILSTIALITPIFLRHPQILVGAIINALLIKGALSLKKYQLLPLIILPCIGVVLGGYLFGGLTKFIFYMIPAIWAGNALLVYIFKNKFYKDKKITNINYLITLIKGAFFKTIFLFLTALIMYKLSLIPQAFLIAMGYMQFITVIIGGIIVLGELKIKKWIKKN